MTRWAALLKGVNLNGRKLPMADLKALVERLGYRDVRTLLASGNVAFDTDEEAGTIVAALETALAGYGLHTDVMLRDHAALERIVAANPFPDAACARPSHLLVVLHRDPVPDAPLARLAESYAGPERLQASGRELYVDFPDGIGASQLTAAMAKAKFPAIATGRNWNTVTKLVALTA